ncbi:MAG: hypothetical protein PHX90_08600, partial [Thermotogota bacterium]|nr:hypothetical protein [Thermotogota bacterium]
LERQLFRLAPLSLSFGFFATKRSHSTMLIAVSYRAGFGPVTRVKVKCASLKAGAPFRIDHRAGNGAPDFSRAWFYLSPTMGLRRMLVDNACDHPR